MLNWSNQQTIVERMGLPRWSFDFYEIINVVWTLFDANKTDLKLSKYFLQLLIIIKSGFYKYQTIQNSNWPEESRLIGAFGHQTLVLFVVVVEVENGSVALINRNWFRRSLSLVWLMNLEIDCCDYIENNDDGIGILLEDELVGYYCQYYTGVWCYQVV